MAKIGVFDSGVGGLTILKKLMDEFPLEEFIYLGDTARLPYGSKSPETIRKYCEQVMSFLIQQKVDAIVIACNSASTQVPEKEWQGIPVFNVIDPGTESALKISKTLRIGLLGTRATVGSNVYHDRILKLSPDAKVFSQSCPLFVPLAEEGWIDDPITNLVVFRYIQPIITQGIDTLILGCTHYNLLANSIDRAIRSSHLEIQIADSAQALADALKNEFDSGRLQYAKKASLRILMTDESKHTNEWTQKILGLNLSENFETVVL
jgi:glutamate racemase